MNESIKPIRKLLVELAQMEPINAPLVETLTIALRAEEILKRHYGSSACLHVRVRSKTLVTTSVTGNLDVLPS